MSPIKKRQFYDEYVLEEKIGKGHFAFVYRAHSIVDPKRKYAVKIINKEQISDKSLKRLQQEINNLKIIDHPNIVKYFETFIDPNYIYLLMELCEGGEVFSKIVNKPMDEKTSAKIMIQVFKAVKYLHNIGIMHRDLKPENIMFVNKDSDDIKIIDFGLSKQIQRQMERQNMERLELLQEEKDFLNGEFLKRDDIKDDESFKFHKDLLHSIVGTPYYVAPEVLSQVYDERCDMWSMGVLLYILLCGYPPFNGRTSKEVINSVKRAQVNFSTEEWLFVTDEAKDLIVNLLQKPKKRLNIDQCLNHKWINMHVNKSMHQEMTQSTFVDTQSLIALQNTHEEDFEKKALNSLLHPVSQLSLVIEFKKLLIKELSYNKLIPFMNLFKELDIESNGYLSITQAWINNLLTPNNP
eukprot:403337504